MKTKTAGVAFFTNPLTGDRVVKNDGEYYYTKSYNIYDRVEKKQKLHTLFKLTQEHEYRASDSMKEAIEEYNGEFDVEIIETSTFEEASIILDAEHIKLKNQ